MKRILYILTLSILSLVGCNGSGEAVVFESLRIPETAKNANDATCNIDIRIDYAKGGAAADAINKAILQCGLFPKECVTDGKEKDFPKAAEGIANYYKNEFEASDAEYVKLESDSIVYAPGASAYYYVLGSEVSHPCDSIINYQIGYDSFMGGVRNTYQIAALNFAAKTGRLIKLKDFIRPEAEGKITDMIVADVAKQYECASLQELQGNHLIFNEFDPYVPENFVIGRDSVEFIYNCEEVAHYAVGAIVVKFAYKDLTGCLR